MKKKIITKQEYLMLAGLLCIAQKAMKEVEYCEKAVVDLLEIEQSNGLDSGHFGDAVWNEGNINEVLRKEGVKVLKK